MIEIFVSTVGNDKSKGSPAQPVATVGRALEMLRGKTEQRRVIVRGGVYPLAAPIEVGKADQGVEIIAASGETPEFTGARGVNGTWKKESDGFYSLSGVGGVVGQVWVGGVRYKPATYPNDGSFFVSDRTTSQTTITCRDVKITEKNSDAVVRPYSWYEEVIPCAVTPGRVLLASACRESLARQGEPGVFRLRNCRAGLVAGAWYHDRAAAILYVMLDGNHAEKDLKFARVSNGPIALLNCEASDVVIDGLTFRDSNTRRLLLAKGGDYTSHAVRVMGAANVFLTHLSLRDVGAGGIFASNTVDFTASDCVIERSGESAVSVIGESLTQSGQTPVSRSARIDRCTIRLPGQSCASYAGLHIASVYGAMVSHTRISGCPHNGIRVNGNEGDRAFLSATGNLNITMNVIDGALSDCSDGAGVYFWGAQKSGGVVCNNLIRNIGAPRRYKDDVLANVGIYADDWASQIEAQGNVIENCDWGLNFHRCKNFIATNNLIIGVRRHWWNQQWEAPKSDQGGNSVAYNTFMGAKGCTIKSDWGLQGLSPPPLVASANSFVEDVD